MREVLSERERQAKYAADVKKKREEERLRTKATPNQNMAQDKEDRIDSYPFWCDTCRVDFDAEAFKTIHRLGGDHIVSYRTFHEDCGDESVRLLTHRDHDPYYSLSEMINYQRNEYADDLLQADQYGFKNLYGDPYEDYTKRLQEKEKRLLEERSELGLKGASLAQKERRRRFNTNY